MISISNSVSCAATIKKLTDITLFTLDNLQRSYKQYKIFELSVMTNNKYNTDRLNNFYDIKRGGGDKPKKEKEKTPVLSEDGFL